MRIGKTSRSCKNRKQYRCKQFKFFSPIALTNFVSWFVDHSAGDSDHLTSSSISFGKVSTLDHELFDDSVEFASLVTKSFLWKREMTHVKRAFRTWQVVVYNRSHVHKGHFIFINQLI